MRSLKSLRVVIDPIVDRDGMVVYRLSVFDVSFMGSSEISGVRDIAFIDSLAIVIELLQSWPLHL